MNSKPTNPKDIIGSDKLPLDLVPPVINAYASLAFLEGALKYGRFNYRIKGVRASIYYSAVLRHLSKWWDGEDTDKDTGVHHLASAIACIGIVLDAKACGKLKDDRPPSCDSKIDTLSAIVPKLKEMFKTYNPTQYTIEDTE